MDYLNQAVTDKSEMGKLSGSEKKKKNTETKLSQQQASQILAFPNWNYESYCIGYKHFKEILKLLLIHNNFSYNRTLESSVIKPQHHFNRKIIPYICKYKQPPQI